MLVSAKEMLAESKSRPLCSRSVQHQQPGVDKGNPCNSSGVQFSGYPWCIRGCRKIHDRLTRQLSAMVKGNDGRD